MWGNNAGALRLRAGRTVVLAPREHALPRVTGLRQRALALCAPCDSCAFRLRAKRLLLCESVLAGARALRGCACVGRTVVLAPSRARVASYGVFRLKGGTRRAESEREALAPALRETCVLAGARALRGCARACARGREHYGALMSTAGLFFDIIRTICHGGR